MINKHGKERAAAVKIQSIVRGARGRDVLRELMERQLEGRSVTRIATCWRGRMARVYVKQCRYNRWLRHVSSIRIQCLFRVKYSRRVAQRLRDKKWKIGAPYSAVKIQRVFRGKRGRDKAVKIHNAHCEMMLKKRTKCIQIQSMFRSWIAKRLRHKLEIERQSRIEFERICTVKIQAMWRSHIAQDISQRLRQINKMERERIDRAKKSISKFMIATKFRLHINRRISYRIMLNCLASSIQKWYRERKDISRRKEEEAIRIEKCRNESCILIQKTWYRKVAYMKRNELIKMREERNALKREKAIIISKWTRMCMAQKLLGRLRAQRIEALKKQLKLETWASIQISSGWRGYKGREKTKSVIRSRQARWKQMWSDKDQRYFFFNQVRMAKLFYPSIL